MKIFIAHRGLTTGPNERWENHPDQIRQTLAAGFDCEIDVRLIDGKWLLGHDLPQYEVDTDFLMLAGLWIHCKNHDALANIGRIGEAHSTWHQPTHFWHQSDDYTLTSNGFIWTYPGKPVDPQVGICVQPEWDKNWKPAPNSVDGVGVCSKFVKIIKGT